ncbi:MAG: cytochrome c biogenesis protein ResB, partial [Dehalococcoidales bacterium]|nr:cytochrome c biogenesis protein ResB [Dehalococcoidales bacterium]
MNALSVVQTITPATPTQRLWRLLCSVRLALVLILLITTVSLAGAIIIQASDEVLRSPQSYNRWVEGLGSRFGLLTGLMDFLGLFRVFRTWWFNTLAAILVINMTTCTINRFPAMWRTVRRPRVKVAPAFFERGRLRARFSSLSHSQQEATDVMVKALRRRRFQVTIENESDGIRIYAERNRYTRFGTFLTHGGIILALAAAILGNMAGFSDNGLVIPNGSVRAVGHSTGLSVLNEGFIEEDYPDGRPKDYRSDLVIYKRGIEVKRGTVRVNEPVSYKGIRLHQSYFGNAAVIRVKDSAGDGVLFEDGVSLAYRNEMYGKARPVGSFTLFNG